MSAHWTPEENARLKHLFEVECKTKAQIAEIMPGRTLFSIGKHTLDLGLKYQGRPSGWTPEQNAQLRQLWCVEGLSASQIAERMPGRVRNAVIGRVHRLGLSSASRAEATRAQQNIKPVKPRRPSVPRNMIRFGNVAIPRSVIPAKRSAPECLAGAPVTLLERLVTLLERRGDQCGWPVNDGNPFLFCGAPRATGHKRYCEHHAWVGVKSARAA